MKRILFIMVFALAVNAILAQTYKMKIKQGAGTTYSVTSTVDEITFLNTTTSPFVCGDVILYGGGTYETILIGSQCWFQKDLNVGTRINGGIAQTNNSTIEKYCYGNLDKNCTTFGGLYQWAEAVQYLNGATNTTSPNPAFSGNVQGICPSGWHIPTLTELTTLQTTAGGSTFAAALLVVGQGYLPQLGTNTSGFSALFAGVSEPSSPFYIGIGTNVNFWSSSEYDAANVYFMRLDEGVGTITLFRSNKEYGFSVRCLKD